MSQKQNILIIGAGLCGSLLALRLGQRGHQVTLIEKRPDLRKVELDAGRSINLALSARGLKAMKMVGLENEVNKLCLPMLGRMIHDKEGNTFMSQYSGRSDEYINSISRPGLNMILLDAAEKLSNVSLIFNQACTKVDLKNASVNFKAYETGEETTIQADVIFGTDGSGSAVRNSMFQDRNFLFSFSIRLVTSSSILCSTLQAVFSAVSLLQPI